MRRGFIAQEVERVVPEAVHTADEDHLERFQNITIKGLKTLDMERIIFELIGAVQQLSKEVGELRKLGVNA